MVGLGPCYVVYVVRRRVSLLFARRNGSHVKKWAVKWAPELFSSLKLSPLSRSVGPRSRINPDTLPCTYPPSSDHQTKYAHVVGARVGVVPPGHGQIATC